MNPRTNRPPVTYGSDKNKFLVCGRCDSEVGVLEGYLAALYMCRNDGLLDCTMPALAPSL